MSTSVTLLIFPRQRLRRAQEEVGKLSDSVMRLYELDLSGLRWAECREGVVARLKGGASPEMLVRIPSAKLECTALMVSRSRESGWSFRLCWKGTVEDAFETGQTQQTPPGPVTPEQHAARLARRFPKLDREALLACLAREEDSDAPEEFLGILAPWARQLLALDQLAPAPAAPVPDLSSPEQNAPDRSEGQRPPEPEPGIETCLPFLTAVRALRRGWSFPLSLLYVLFPNRRPRPEEIPCGNWTARELEEVLSRFCRGELDRLELDFTLQGAGNYVRRLGKTVYQPVRATLELIREKGRCMCLFLDDQDSSLYRLIADKTPYMTVDSEDLEKTVFHGQTVEAYTVFPEPSPVAIPREAAFLLARLNRRDAALSATSRMGVWSHEGAITNTPADKERHQERRKLWCMG